MISAITHASVAAPVRARELGVPFDGTPGKLNAITDVGLDSKAGRAAKRKWVEQYGPAFAVAKRTQR